MKRLFSVAFCFAYLTAPTLAQTAPLSGGFNLAPVTSPATTSTAAESNAADSNGANASTTPMTLFGGVSHSDSLQHVNHSLDKHRKNVKMLDAKVDTSAASGPLTGSASQTKLAYIPMTGIAQPTETPTKLTAQVQTYVLEWFMIPKFLAGKWEKAGDLTVSITDLKTGQQTFPNEWTENEQESTWGHQADAAGNVWHVNFLPAEKDGKSGDTTVRFLTLSQKCEKSDPTALMTRTQYIISQSSAWTTQAANMFQQESLNHYFSSGQQEMTNNSTNRVFSYEGEALRDGHLQTKFSKIAEFSPTTAINGVDLKSALNDYLESHNMSQLMSK